MTTSCGLALALALLAQAAPDIDGKDGRAARLAFIKASLATYDVHPADDPARKFRLLPEPVIRFTNPVGVSEDGAIFFWVGDDGRPEVAIQAFLQRGGAWIHDFSSLSTAPVVAETRRGPAWFPSRAGVEFRPVPDAPRPAASPEARLRQIRALAQDFAAEDHFEGKAWSPLRLLPRPLARYGKPGAAVEDGALFAFVLGTDPEVSLMIEARPGPGGLGWQYAFAPMTSYEVKGSHRGRPSWSLPWRSNAKDPGETFYDMDYGRDR